MMKDKIIKILLLCSGLFIFVLIVGIAYMLVSESIPAFRHFGFFNFIISPEWDDGQKNYGALLFIAGSFMTTILALIISIPFSLSLSLFCEEMYKGKKIARIIKYMVDLLANIPSVVLAVWAYYSVRPLFISLNIGYYGYGVLTTSLILSLMIIPYTASLNNYFFSLVPKKLRESAYSLGATRLDVIRMVSLPNAKNGIYATFAFAFARTLGESIIVVMFIGNAHHFPSGIKGCGCAMASVILNQTGSADNLKFSSLMAIALLLSVFTSIIYSWGLNKIKKFEK